jgi:hypothetical protein
LVFQDVFDVIGIVKIVGNVAKQVVVCFPVHETLAACVGQKRAENLLPRFSGGEMDFDFDVIHYVIN